MNLIDFIDVINVMLFFLSQVVDMRWGVRDEATDDHMTTQLCMQEIDNCQRLSMGPNFVVISLILLIFLCSFRCLRIQNML